MAHTPQDSERRCTRHQAGFTLVELLIVITIITVLAGLTLSVVNMVRESARVLQTSSRMQAIINALTSYGSHEGGAAAELQNACALGGSGRMATIAAIVDSIIPGCAAPPDFLSMLRAGGSTVFTSYNINNTNYASSLYNGNNTQSSEVIHLYQRLSKQLFDVMPPSGAMWTPGDYTTNWAFQWPETDWILPAPGANPPILPFPWGKAGLRIDGTLCDVSVPEGLGYPNVSQFNEEMNSGGAITMAKEPTGNSWATLGNLDGRIWKWTSANPAQTDWVTLNRATRSDGIDLPPAALAANKPMPFDLGWLSPLKSIQLMQAAGIIPPGAAGLDAYRNDRRAHQPWNDAWGSPLIVVYAIFQPQRYQRAFDLQNRRDLFIHGSLSSYQYARSLYLAVGAAGYTRNPGVPATWIAADDATVQRDYWLQIRDVCKASDWTESSFTSPPWKDVRVKKKNGKKCLLSTPNELK